MSGVILAYLAQPGSARSLLLAAQHLASLCTAQRINVLAVRRPPIETIIPSEEVLTPDRETRVRTEEQQRVTALKADFDRSAAELPAAGPSTEWFDIEANAATAIKEHGGRADVIVLKRPGDSDPAPQRQAQRAALFEAERPMLAVPPGWAPTGFGRRVLIAWRDDPRTVKAVLWSLHLLDAAECIDIVQGLRVGLPAAGLPAIFREHGIAATLHSLKLPGAGAFGAAVLTAAETLGSDLLVMGAYAHSPLHNFILGGVTAHMLAHAEIPVLLRH